MFQASQSPPIWPLWAQYSLALGAVFLALGARWVLDPILGDAVPFITVFAVMLLLVLSVRPGPFVAASTIGGIGAIVLFIQPRFSLMLSTPSDALQLALFGTTVIAAVFAAWLAERIKNRHHRAEEELAHRGEELRLVTDAVPALIAYIDTQFRYQFVNARYEDWFGLAPVEIVGRDLSEVLGVAAFEHLRPHAEAALAGRRVRFEGRVQYRSGTRQIRAEYVPDRRSDGTVAGFHALVSDISEQKQAETAQARLAAIVETSGDAILSISLDGEILTWNAGAERLFGYSAAEAVGRSMNLILPPAHADDERSIRERVRRGEVIGPYDTVRRTKDGRHIDVSVTVSPIRDASGRIIGASKLDRDITERKQAEQALRESQRRLATLVGNLPGMAYRYRNQPGWPVDFMSERVCDIVGHEPQEFLDGQVSWVQLTRPEDLDKVRAAVQAGVQARRPYQIEYRVIHRDGAERWVWERGEPVVENGEVVALEGFVTDVTQRKRVEHELEASRARERSYLEHLPVGVWFANEKGELVFANAAARRIWGDVPTLGSHDYRNFEAYWHGTAHRLSADEWALARALRHGETSIGEELDICTFDGHRRTILNSAVPVRDSDGLIIGGVVMNLDITEPKRTELALKDADRRKDEFLATLAHELRNPLAAIRTATELLGGRITTEQQHDRITGVIKRQVALMVRLIDDLLEVSRITHGTLELRTERTSLPALVNQALDAAQPWIERKRHHIEVEGPSGALEVEGDAVRLVQVFTNILNNACKYSEPGGRIRVRIDRTGDEAIVEIIDNGIGIPRDKLDSIFEMFAQIDSPGRSDGGLGIGLTLSRRLVEMHHGTMTAASEGPGHGSRFTVCIPALPALELAPARRASASEVQQPETARSQHGRRVLVVDDNVDAADTLANLLRAYGHATRTAYDGTSALAEVAAFQPEVLLLDLGLPDINGTDVCRAIRAEPWGKGMLVVALSGWGQERDKRRTAEAGFDAHLTKPANLGELTSLLAGSSPTSMSG